MEQSSTKSPRSRTRTKPTRTKPAWHSPWVAMLLLVPTVLISLHFRRRTRVFESDPASAGSESTEFDANPASGEEYNAPPQDVQEAPPVAIVFFESGSRQINTQMTYVKGQQHIDSLHTVAVQPDRISVKDSSLAKQDTFPSAAHKPTLQLPLEWKTPVGCDFSGFFVEVLGYIVALEARAPAFRLDVGRCTEAMLEKVGLKEREVLRRLQSKKHEVESVALEQTVLVQHMWPRDYHAFGSR
eukprot:8746419-Pyramimonas_sp.AAC.2